MERLDGRVALVTSARRGIGAAVSRALDGAGVRRRPRNHRVLEVALRPVTETSWG
jgi:NAD(P)-dependent dehydrogenase (short-subunit alcohol dehydrogenase family)